MSKEKILNSRGAGEAYNELLKGHYRNGDEREASKYLPGMTDEDIARAKAEGMTPEE